MVWGGCVMHPGRKLSVFPLVDSRSMVRGVRCSPSRSDPVGARGYGFSNLYQETAVVDRIARQLRLPEMECRTCRCVEDSPAAAHRGLFCWPFSDTGVRKRPSMGWVLISLLPVLHDSHRPLRGRAVSYSQIMGLASLRQRCSTIGSPTANSSTMDRRVDDDNQRFPAGCLTTRSGQRR